MAFNIGGILSGKEDNNSDETKEIEKDEEFYSTSKPEYQKQMV